LLETRDTKQKGPCLRGPQALELVIFRSFSLYHKILCQARVGSQIIKIQKQIIEKISAVQEYKKQLLAQKSKLKELFDSVLAKSMKGN